MDQTMEKDCVVMEEFFQQIILDMKNSFPVWEDFITKAGRLHAALRTTSTCTSAFLESFQKVADMAAGTRGSTREIGSALTRLCLRHRSIDSKLKTFTSAIMETMVSPLQERLDEWKRMVIMLDREHARDNKKLHNEIRRAAAEVTRLQKKAKKGKTDVTDQLDQAVRDANEKLLNLHNLEKQSVRTALVEERSRLCLFVSGLKPVMDEEVSMLSEVNHIQEIVQSLCMVSNDPESLPPSTEHLIVDLLKTVGEADVQQKSKLMNNSSAVVDSHIHSHSESGGSSSPAHHYSATYQRSYSVPVSGSAGSSDLILQPQYCPQTSADASQSSILHSSEISDAHDDRNTAVSAGFNRSMSLMASSADNRPHTISSAYERSSHSRPVLSADIFVQPPSNVQSRPPSVHGTLNTAGFNSSSPYAVPCIVPKRRDTSVTGGVKVADIYARPSLVGARASSARVLPVATPTVPDMPGGVGVNESPLPVAAALSTGIPVAGYVNMNQLAHLALQHQGLSQLDKKDYSEAGFGVQSRDFGGGDGSGGMMDFRSHPDLRMQQMLASSSSSAMYSSARQMDMNPGTYDLDVVPDSRVIAARLELACRLQPANGYSTLNNRRPFSETSGYCTLPRRPAASVRDTSHWLSMSAADITTLYTNKKSSGDRLPMAETSYQSASLSRAYSVTGVPPSGRHTTSKIEVDRGGRPRSTVTTSSGADTVYMYDRESPVL